MWFILLPPLISDCMATLSSLSDPRSEQHHHFCNIYCSVPLCSASGASLWLTKQLRLQTTAYLGDDGRLEGAELGGPGVGGLLGAFGGGRLLGQRGEGILVGGESLLLSAGSSCSWAKTGELSKQRRGWRSWHR